MKQLDSSTIIEIFKRRYACKKFDASKSIADSDFATILESGRLSPSSFGFEPWHFVVLQNKTERQKTLREKLKQSVWGRHSRIGFCQPRGDFVGKKTRGFTTQQPLFAKLNAKCSQNG